MKPLSILLFDVFELEPHYLDAWCTAMQEWNGDALGDAQIIAISQRETTEVLEGALDRHGIQASVVKADHEFADGYPIWDTLKSIRQVWNQVEGRHVTFNHPEFIWGPRRLRRTIDYLRSEKPYFALGNLRRPGTHEQIVQQKTSDHCIADISEKFRQELMEAPALAKLTFEAMPTSWWMFWTQAEQQPGAVNYIEDVNFCDKEWLDSWGFTKHGGEMPFQDIYDLLRIAMTTILPKHGTMIQTYRMPQDVHRMIHLWHPKAWRSFTPEVRNWFLRDILRWKGTPFSNLNMWARLIEVSGEMPKTYQPVNDLRNGPGGTVIRYGQGLDSYLSNGGGPRVAGFYQRNGRNNRTS